MLKLINTLSIVGFLREEVEEVSIRVLKSMFSSMCPVEETLWWSLISRTEKKIGAKVRRWVWLLKRCTRI